MPIRNVTLIDDKVTVNPCDIDLEKLQISRYSRLYVGLIVSMDNEYSSAELYLLHNVLVNKKWEYRWLALWNTDTWTSIKGISSWDSIEDALKAALDNGWIVRQLNNDYFKYLIEEMQRDAKNP